MLGRLKAVRLGRLRAAQPVVLDDSSTAGPAVDSLVDINTAAADELQSLPGIGPVLAARIVAHRHRFGPFRTIEQLEQVPGIGPKRLAALRGFIRAGSEGSFGGSP
ncbi:MAG: helix-hairpin-helix domain-containing protein [candidate division WOR-3 bacterium]